MSTDEVVNTSEEKQPGEEHFSNVLEEEKSQLQFSEQVNIFSSTYRVVFALILFNFKPKSFCQMNRSWDLWPKPTDLTHIQTAG